MSSIFLDKSSTLPISDNRFDKGPFFEFYHKEDNSYGVYTLIAIFQYLLEIKSKIVTGI